MGLLDGTTQSAYYSGNDFGNYQFVSLDDIITQFQIAYVGEGKIIPKIKRTDVAFHAQRALQELSFDTFKSFKAQEIVVPATLQMILPQDYVNYTKVSWVDSAGIKHLLYPMSKTSNPEKYQIDTNGEYLFQAGSLIPSGEMVRNGNFHGSSEHWTLNQTFFNNNALPTNYTASTVTQTSAATPPPLADPSVGWFYGYDGNVVRAYDVEQYAGITQTGVNIKSGEQYKVSVTASGYTSGSFVLTIIDELGDISPITAITSNGTFSEILTAGVIASQHNPSTIMLRNASSALGNITIDNISIVRVGDEETSTTWSNYKSGTPLESQDDYIDDTYWPMNGGRYGLDPQHAQANGSFYIDNNSGKIHFSSNISGKTVVLDYISDGLGTDEEMQVHKFAEEAMYKYIVHAIMSTSSFGQQLVPRLTKERFAAVRKAKLRLSNIKLEEITQVLRGKSKQIKH
jgi:hypothetical protein